MVHSSSGRCKAGAAAAQRQPAPRRWPSAALDPAAWLSMDAPSTPTNSGAKATSTSTAAPQPAGQCPPRSVQTGAFEALLRRRRPTSRVATAQRSCLGKPPSRQAPPYHRASWRRRHRRHCRPSCWRSTRPDRATTAGAAHPCWLWHRNAARRGSSGRGGGGRRHACAAAARPGGAAAPAAQPVCRPFQVRHQPRRGSSQLAGKACLLQPPACAAPAA